jgi:putative transcriptional regulator
MVTVQPGLLLISDPFLKDPNFSRTVILICEHDSHGSLGFVLNKLYEDNLSELLQNIGGINFPVYHGGPVHEHTLHFLHKRPDLISDGLEISDGIFWGGNFEEVIILLQQNKLTQNDIRFYIGYSGWGEGQLEEELQAKSWITRDSTQHIIFHKNVEQLWQYALKDLGGEYALMVHYPNDPQLN